MPGSSRIEGFHKLAPAERLALVADRAGITPAAVAPLGEAGALGLETADRLIENCVGTLAVPIGIATNLVIDGVEILVPMATEESSVVAAVCHAAKLARGGGGFVTSATDPVMIAQIQLLEVADPEAARIKILERRDEIRALCDAQDPPLIAHGGGFRDLEVRVIDAAGGPMVVTHILVDTRDAMGANAVNTMAEALAPTLAGWTGGRALLRILSNLADRRLARARCVWRTDDIGGAAVRDGIVAAFRFADADPYRAATHNKGVMNGVTAVVLATGNDTRAVEAGAHAHAAGTGRYRSLSRWEVTAEGDLSGVLELPLAVGLIGGATRIHPTAQACLAVMGVDTGPRLARIIAAVGLAQNFAALRVLATTGVQKGHMALHAQNIAIMAGATGAEIDRVARAMVARGEVRIDVARALLDDPSSGAGG